MLFSVSTKGVCTVRVPCVQVRTYVYAVGVALSAFSSFSLFLVVGGMQPGRTYRCLATAGECDLVEALASLLLTCNTPCDGADRWLALCNSRLATLFVNYVATLFWLVSHKFTHSVTRYCLAVLARTHVAAARDIELGELLCDSLDGVSGSSQLRFAMSSTEVCGRTKEQEKRMMLSKIGKQTDRC